eukprot:gb/GEZJ01000001.1/.p1 GENE.gb/GEZJ01000001.1/~~gb/GEZJ01000001.1/.p1  ORF type:complete len:170 (+),score=23.78 gb/GEZJ01000001.1/:1635-2144(+)
MGRETYSAFVYHFASYVRRFIPNEDSVLLLLNGNSSRKGHHWLDVCHAFNVQVIQLPANSSHFLQHCDSLINKRFEAESRELHELFLLTREFPYENITFKMKISVAKYCAVTLKTIICSFSKMVLWAMDYKFLKNVKQIMTITALGDVVNKTTSVTAYGESKRLINTVA